MDAFFKLLAAGPLVLRERVAADDLRGHHATDVGIRPFGYVTSLVATIGLWLTLSPAVGAIGREKPGEDTTGSGRS